MARAVSARSTQKGIYDYGSRVHHAGVWFTLSRHLSALMCHIIHLEFFSEGIERLHNRWLRVVASLAEYIK